MTEVYKRMLNEEDDDSPAKCRERRRRRIEMRRLAITSAAGSPTPASQSRREDLPSSSSSLTGSSAATAAAAVADEPVFGTMSVSGRSRDMEDAIAARINLCLPEINGRRPVHFFGVYDGHGGPHVAALCRERMHVFVEEELMRVACTGKSESGVGTSSQQENEEQQGQHEVEEEEEEEEEEELWEDKWRRVMKRSFERMDEMALSTCVCGSVGYQCGCHPMEVPIGGSTAVVAMLTPEHIVVANCGDSRAVLCRAGRAIPLSCDHKPDRSDELTRIEAAGGRVIFLNGARVEGILAMSRAIGDKYLKRVVTSEPEITFTKREPEDECLILASDGLWDVLSSDLACEVACECLREGNRSAPAAMELNAGPQIEDEGAGALYPSRSVLAAALLTRLALGRKSSDNISVIVVDLKSS